MSTQTAAEGRPAPAPPPGGAWKQPLSLFILVTCYSVVAVLILYVAVSISGISMLTFLSDPTRVHVSAAPDAVQVSVSVASLNMDASTDGPVLTTRVITAPHIVADLFARINALPSLGRVYGSGCTLPGLDAVSFGFRFLRAGALVETAIQRGDGCGGWWLSAGRVREQTARYDPHGEWQVILSEVQPLGCPQAWVPKCEGY